MNVQHILLDDNNPLHRELSIYRTGTINRIKLQDTSYKIYGTMEICGHDYAALFHYSLPELLNQLPFITESGNGLDSWDEAFLHNSILDKMIGILDERINSINIEQHETILLGWHDQPVGVAYFRDIDPTQFVVFLQHLKTFAETSASAGDDLEFIL